MKKDYNAIIKIYDIPTMNSYKRMKLSQWLRQTAEDVDNLEKEGNASEFNKIYTLKLMK